MTINCNGKLLDLTSAKVAGILNITPDSFFDGGKYINDLNILKRSEEIIKQGADILDIGAYSSRPGAEHISSDEELSRLIPALKLIRKEFPEIIISIDTFRSGIAEVVVKDFNVAIINDISAGNFDDKMFKTIAKLQVPYVIMHMNGMPQTMQNNPKYDDLLKEILLFFAKKKNMASQLGIKDLIIDPGFGFGKSLDDNYKLLKNLNQFEILDLPIFIGLSRKSMIYRLTNEEVKDVLPGTIALNILALSKGANILRVHDVKETIQVVSVFNKYNSI